MRIIISESKELMNYEGAMKLSSVNRCDEIIQSPIQFFSQVPDPTTNRNNISFTPYDIQEAVKGIAFNPAAGPDLVPAMLLKNRAAELSIPLYLLQELHPYRYHTKADKIS